MIPRGIADQVRRMLAPLRRQLANTIARAVVTSINDGTGQQTLQIGVLAGETLDGVKRFQDYGFTSIPPVGAAGLALFVGGDRSQPVVVAVEDPGARPTSGQPGEVRLYHRDGATILLRENGDVVVSAKPGGKVYVDDGSGGTEPLATKSDLENVRTALLGHQHQYVTPLQPAPVQPGITSGGPAIPEVVGTQVLEAK